MSKILYIVSSFPTESETFVRNEIQYLSNNMNFQVTIFSIFKPSLVALEIPDLPSSIIIYAEKPLRHLWSVRWRYFPAFFMTSNTSNILRRFRDWLMASHICNKIKGLHVEHVHAHFAGFTTDIALKVAQMLNVPCSFSAHAQDIYTQRKATLKRKVANARFVVTCSEENKRFLSELTGCSRKIHRVYHGVDLARWPLKTRQSSKIIFRIVVVARLVEKKGIKYLIAALVKALKEISQIECVIIGDGPLKKELAAFASEHQVLQHITFKGFLPPSEIYKLLQESDVFVLPSIVLENGDRDVIANVLLEAMSTGVPVITTDSPAVREILNHEVNGILVKQADSEMLADAIIRLYNNESFARSLALTARSTVSEQFELGACHQVLAQLFREHAKNQGTTNY